MGLQSYQVYGSFIYIFYRKLNRMFFSKKKNCERDILLALNDCRKLILLESPTNERKKSRNIINFDGESCFCLIVVVSVDRTGRDGTEQNKRNDKSHTNFINTCHENASTIKYSMQTNEENKF